MISLDLRNKIIEYIDKKITLEQLEDWIVPREANLLRLPDSNDADLIATVELGLAEISNGNWSEEKFRRELGNALLIETIWLQIEPGQSPQISTSTSDVTVMNVNGNFSPIHSMVYSSVSV